MAQNIIVEGLLPGGECLNFVVTEPMMVYHLKQQIGQKVEHPYKYFLTSSGVALKDNDRIILQRCFTVLRAHPLLLGGKGGFGTLIRAMGTGANKGARKGACRDLSGRRMRDVDAEKKLAKWMAEEPERKKKCLERRKEKREKQRRQPKHQFNDPSYMDQIRSTEENIDSALQQGLAASTETRSKRKLPEASTRGAVKKQKIWVGVDGENDDFSDSDTASVNTSDTEKPEDGSESKDGQLVDVGEISALPSDGATTPNVDKTSCLPRNGSAITTGKTSETHVGEPSPEIVDVRLESQTTSSSVELQLQGLPPQAIDIEEFSTVEELVSKGGDVLKYTLQSMGLKCGGTVRERAQRLLSIKGKAIHELDQSLFAKNKKWKTKKPL